MIPANPFMTRPLRRTPAEPMLPLLTTKPLAPSTTPNPVGAPIDAHEQEKLLAEQYAALPNITKAALVAGMSRAQASATLTRPEVRERVQALMNERAERTRIDGDKVLKELARIAFHQITDFVEIRDGKVCVKNTNTLHPDDIAAIAGIRADKDGNIEIKFHSKPDALRDIGKHLKLFTDVSESRVTFTQMGTVTLTDKDGNERSLTFDIGEEPDSTKLIDVTPTR